MTPTPRADQEPEQPFGLQFELDIAALHPELDALALGRKIELERKIEEVNLLHKAIAIMKAVRSQLASEIGKIHD